MRISSGVAEIGISTVRGNRIIAEKAFIWPVYDAGSVNRIRGVARHTDSNVSYAKPSPEDHIELLRKADRYIELEYTPSGAVARRNLLAYQPGSFFDALV